MVKLFIVGFPREADELQLVEMFSAHGLVNTVTIIRDQVSGTSKGYAFVEMLDAPSADRAIEALNGSAITGRTLSVRIAENKRAPAGSEPLTGNSTNKQHTITEKHKRPRKNRF
jgi:RNA recognition motif-containing protein